MHSNTCIQATAMSHRYFPLATARGLLHLPRCALAKPPEPLRADDLPRPTTTPCNSQETRGAKRLLSYIRVRLEKRPTFLPPTQLRGRLPPSSPPPPLTRSSYGRSYIESSLPLPANISQQNTLIPPACPSLNACAELSNRHVILAVMSCPAPSHNHLTWQ
jgi:hypothetical protein